MKHHRAFSGGEERGAQVPQQGKDQEMPSVQPWSWPTTFVAWAGLQGVSPFTCYPHPFTLPRDLHYSPRRPF